MLNYIILNGKKSTDITGLLISTLPAISKPMVRTEILEIDGRDGDIVTKLGYSAYDKEFVIGLHGDFDIDEVIGFFDSEGTVVFSNEITKFYRYQILEQIDFEKLIRFRQATVRMHVQPFKYSTIEERKELIDRTQLLQMQDVTVEENGVTATASTAFIIDIPGFPATTGIIRIQGSPVGGAELLVPVTANLDAGSHSLNFYTIPYNDDVDAEECFAGMVKDGTVYFFGNQQTRLVKNAPVEITALESVSKEYNYLYFYVPDGADVDFIVGAWMRSGNDVAMLLNRGNVISRPRLIVEGSGNITIALNGMDVFRLTMGEDDTITIDCEKMDAYTGDTLRNRSVKGNYDNFALKVGENTITWTGNVTQITVENYSRWL